MQLCKEYVFGSDVRLTEAERAEVKSLEAVHQQALAQVTASMSANATEIEVLNAYETAVKTINENIVVDRTQTSVASGFLLEMFKMGKINQD